MTNSTRFFSHLPTLRPALPGAAAAAAAPAFRAPLSRTPTSFAAATLDLVPKTAISAHPALLGAQIRCGPRPTMSGATRLIQKRRHGFLSRLRTAKGRKMLARRRAKGRRRLSA
ncbi:hypothetical protein P8C59_000306 [Phyllachora maydis]|uniref:Ribosomal protein L34 n=1 Tax=Phyllachora maydis TaxID=1825666 RepID=A0AAD9HXD4_9PEZI|nr:hypothetical protein P8C59_000306 [Phyllachora maydis]